MMLRIHVDGTTSYEIGDEIWQQSLAAVIREEAELIADSVGSGLLDGSARQLRNVTQELIVAAMIEALVQVGDTYQAPDGVVYSLLEPPAQDRHREDMVNEVTCSEPVIEDVLRFEDLPVGSSASRRADTAVVDVMSRGRRALEIRGADLRRGSWELSAYVLSG